MWKNTISLKEENIVGQGTIPKFNIGDSFMMEGLVNSKMSCSRIITLVKETDEGFLGKIDKSQNWDNKDYYYMITFDTLRKLRKVSHGEIKSSY